MEKLVHELESKIFGFFFVFFLMATVYLADYQMWFILWFPRALLSTLVFSLTGFFYAMLDCMLELFVNCFNFTWLKRILDKNQTHHCVSFFLEKKEKKNNKTRNWDLYLGSF